MKYIIYVLIFLSLWGCKEKTRSSNKAMSRSIEKEATNDETAEFRQIKVSESDDVTMLGFV